MLLGSAESAGRFADVFALRGYDSVQLAAAHELNVYTERKVLFACYDSRLNQAAQLLQLQVLPWPAHPLPTARWTASISSAPGPLMDSSSARSWCAMTPAGTQGRGIILPDNHSALTSS